MASVDVLLNASQIKDILFLLFFFLCCTHHITFSASSVLWLLPSFYELLSCSHIILVHKSSLIKISVFIYLVLLSYYSILECTVHSWFQCSTWCLECLSDKVHAYIWDYMHTHTILQDSFHLHTNYWSVLAFSSLCCNYFKTKWMWLGIMTDYFLCSLE